MKKFFTICAMLLTASFAFGQGSTTSSMQGKVTDGSEELIGANVFAVHGPSGTTYGGSTDLNGNFRIPGMRVGGPYKITISYTGFEDASYDGVYLSLGQPYRLDVTIQETAIELGTVMVTAQGGPAGGNIGSSTIIKSDDINRMPTLSRDLGDFTRLTPQSKATFGGGTSIAGVNNRYNAIYIDGAVNNDVFGLAANGTNGGQTGIAPISIDAIEQIQVVVSPYDVTLGGFSGGGISAVTKSGTNNLEGSAYYFTQNESLAGNTNGSLIERTGGEAEALDDFAQNLYGLSLGGPIVKDKVFFFFNGEIQRDETPVPFLFDTYRGDASEADLNNLSNRLISDYGYNPGGFGSKIDALEGLRLFGKLDFNLNESNKLTVRHQYTKAEQFNVNGSNQFTINYENNGVYFPSTTNSFAAELNSMFGTKASNNFVLGITSVRDDRDPIGNDFPYLIIFDGDGQIRLGSEQFSTANLLDQDIVTVTNNFKLYKNAHTITIGTHNEFSSFNNVFVRQNFGVYEFSSIDAFLNGDNADEFYRSYSLVDDVTGDETSAAASFNALQLGVYIQDEWTPNDKLTLTAGIRLDVPILLDDPNIASDFNTTTLPAISAAYDIEGAEGGAMPEGQLMVSPRIGLQYVASDKTNLRGGIGIFTSRIPFVWPGGAYNNNGLTVGSAFILDQAFEADINKQPTNPDFTVPSGQIDLFTQDFRYPQVFRASLAIDQILPGGITATLEGIYTKTLNDVIYKNVNSDPTVGFNWTGGPDDRPVYTRTSLDPTYESIYLGSNTNEGNTYNVSASLAKDFDFGLNTYVAYTYGDANSLMEGTSSQNSSQWRGIFNVDGRNAPLVGRSDFSIGSRIIAAVGYDNSWGTNGLFNTGISIFYNGQSGDPYSYVYAQSSARNINNETGSTSRNRSLIWIPADASQINLVDIDGATAAQQWEALNTFIEQDDYLSENRGGYAEKNGARTPFFSQFDLRIAQSFGVKTGTKTNKLEISLDIFNFANLLNSDWGVIYTNPFDYQLINFEGYEADGTTPQFSFDDERLGDDRFNIFDRGSRWRGRIGIRYTFN
ncbi:TonB-dependent receptor [Lewinella cohaerens]|uniref:TonB-dependent receptor n=1 Tax=Lewinella cohaerens TaxID=70995 RepID=UPI0004759C5F|nr:TonB-dependent receptor [Lewinella cohaerens]